MVAGVSLMLPGHVQSLDALAQLLPRLLMPWATEMKRLLDLWHVTVHDQGVAVANARLLGDERIGQARMLTFMQLLANLYGVLLSSLSLSTLM